MKVGTKLNSSQIKSATVAAFKLVPKRTGVKYFKAGQLVYLFTLYLLQRPLTFHKEAAMQRHWQ